MISEMRRIERCTCGHTGAAHAGGFAACLHQNDAGTFCECQRFTWDRKGSEYVVRALVPTKLANRLDARKANSVQDGYEPGALVWVGYGRAGKQRGVVLSVTRNGKYRVRKTLANSGREVTVTLWHRQIIGRIGKEGR